MFAYCGNNPVGFTDETGNRYCASTSVSSESAYDRFISCDHQQQVVQENLGQYHAPRTYTQEEIVLGADYIAFYNGVPVIKIPTMGQDAFSFGIIFMGNGVNNEQLLFHEYGHIMQLTQIGAVSYTINVVMPSVYGFRKYKKGNLSLQEYYNQPWEYIADVFGGAQREHGPKAAQNGSIYWSIVQMISLLY